MAAAYDRLTEAQIAGARLNYVEPVLSRGNFYKIHITVPERDAALVLFVGLNHGSDVQGIGGSPGVHPQDLVRAAIVALKPPSAEAPEGGEDAFVWKLLMTSMSKNNRAAAMAPDTLAEKLEAVLAAWDTLEIIEANAGTQTPAPA